MTARVSTTRLLLTASFSALTLPAFAQTAAPPPANDGGVQEIIVTATRQEQVLSKVPISVSAFDQKTLDSKGVKSINDVVRFTPGIRYDESSTEISIRGIGSGAGAGTTGIYIDDTPVQIRNLGFSSDDSLPAIFDLERVEVLRGPQGTLFGAGSEGGTVRYITPQPSLDKYSVYSRAEVSSTAHGGMSYEAGVAVGGPIVNDVLGFRVSAYRRHDSGWIDKSDNQGNIYDKNTNSGHVTVLRAALTFQPADGLQITPTIQYQRRIKQDDDYYAEALSHPKKGDFRDSSPEYRRNPDRFILPSLKVDWDLGPARLISNTSYYKRKNIAGYDGTIYDLSYYQSFQDDDAPPLLTPTGPRSDISYYVSPSVVTNRQRIFTQEVRLQSTNPDAPITWVAGVFYQKQKQLSREELRDPLGNRLFTQLFGQTLEEWFGEDAGFDGPIPLYNGIDSYINEAHAREMQIAGFADVTWHITDKLSVTGGARYAKLTYKFRSFADGPQQYGRAEAAGNTKNHPFTPKANVTYQFDRDNMVYGTYAKGFRPAGANSPIPPNACEELPGGGGRQQYQPDTVNSFEVGTKNKLFDRKLSIAASAFQIRWNGIQQYVYLPSCAIQFIDNLGKARARGFDLQVNAVPFPGLTIDGSLGYTDARYTRTAVSPQVGILASKGVALPGGPWSVAIGAQYDFDVGGVDAYARADYQYESKLHRATAVQDPDSISFNDAIRRPSATHFVSARAGAIIGGANISVFVDNLFDTSPLFDELDNDSDFYTASTWRPRTIGLTATYRM